MNTAIVSQACGMDTLRDTAFLVPGLRDKSQGPFGATVNVAHYQKQLWELSYQGLYRKTLPLETHLLNFSGNDYLGLSQHPALQQAMIEATQQYGTGTGSSRLVSGTLALHQQLEDTLCHFLQVPAALVFNSGYQANVAIMQALLNKGDWVFCDRLTHASLLDGIRLSGARLCRTPHLDLNALELALQKAPPEATKWLITESVFSMDGTTPDLKTWATLAEQYGAYTLVDEAHAVGVYGPERRSGQVEAQGVGHRITLQMGTFSKALGGFGAYVGGDTLWREILVNRARGFIYSTSLPPGVVAANVAALERVMCDDTQTKALWDNIRVFQHSVQAQPPAHSLEKIGWQLTESPIQPYIIGPSEAALLASERLIDAGFFVQAIRPPTVPHNSARLRVTLSASQSPQEIQRLVQLIAGLHPESTLK